MTVAQQPTGQVNFRTQRNKHVVLSHFGVLLLPLVASIAAIPTADAAVDFGGGELVLQFLDRPRDLVDGFGLGLLLRLEPPRHRYRVGVDVSLPPASARCREFFTE